jgi:hypothetical protein
MFSVNDEEAKQTGIPTPERYAEIQKARFEAAVEALRWLDDEATMQEAVAEALVRRAGDQADLDHLNWRDECESARREREMEARYRSAMGLPAVEQEDDEIPF